MPRPSQHPTDLPAEDTPPARLIVMVTGAAPGLGKSTLVRELTEALAAEGRSVSSFREDEIAVRVEFAGVMATFRDNGSASVRQLLDASHAYITTCRVESWEVVVQDMLFPYLPSLLAWGCSDGEILDLFRDLAHTCSGFRLVQIHVDGDPSESLPRAVRREDDNWLAWMIAKVGGYADIPEPVTDLDSLASYFRNASDRSRRLLGDAPWPIITIDADLGADHVTREAVAAVRAIRR